MNKMTKVLTRAVPLWSEHDTPWCDAVFWGLRFQTFECETPRVLQLLNSVSVCVTPAPSLPVNTNAQHRGDRAWNEKQANSECFLKTKPGIYLAREIITVNLSLHASLKPTFSLFSVQLCFYCLGRTHQTAFDETGSFWHVHSTPIVENIADARSAVDEPHVILTAFRRCSKAVNKRNMRKIGLHHLLRNRDSRMSDSVPSVLQLQVAQAGCHCNFVNTA